MSPFGCAIFTMQTAVTVNGLSVPLFLPMQPIGSVSCLGCQTNVRTVFIAGRASLTVIQAPKAVEEWPFTTLKTLFYESRFSLTT